MEEKRKQQRRQRRQLLLLFLMLSSPTSIGPVAEAATWDGVAITSADFQGLLAVKRSFIDRHGVLRSWNGTGIGACSGAWAGIKCVRGQVVALRLPWRGLSGRLSPDISQLTALRKLSLHDNAIGGPIPAAISLLRQLRGVYLFNNRFSGEIPLGIVASPELQTLDLSNNSLSGSISASVPKNSKLIRLNLSYNNLSGSIPDTVTRLPSLVFLFLQHNNLSGPIPDTWRTYQLQSLNLEHNFLSGSIPISLTHLHVLEVLSLSNNQLSGSIPQEFGALSGLKSLDLSQNSISGSFPESICNLSSLIELNLVENQIESLIPAAIDGLKNLSLLSLNKNHLFGEIPASIGNISSLSQLDLSENNFTGGIPASIENLTNLTFFNVSNNHLSGPVPVVLSKKFNSSSFSGNIELCGYSVSAPCHFTNPSSPSSSPKPIRRRFSSRDVILIAVGVFLALLFFLCCVLLCCLIKNRAAARKRRTATREAPGRGEKPGSAAGSEGEASGEAGGKLVHFDGPLAFTANDLLCATAEIMGKSTYGTVYKATLEDGSQVAVKRLREKAAKGQKDFEAEVSALGRIRHPNLLPLMAFYLGPKGEKLLVFDFLPKGSLATFLHARGPDTPIDWPTRMRIAMGVTRGIHYLHAELNKIHGNLTSSNVLLDENANPKISDYGLFRLMTDAAASNAVATAGTLGYRAPELSKLKKANAKTDVYSLGVIILELLTGKSPADATNDLDLPQWVASIVKEEWTNEVFDLELMKDVTAAAGDELLNTLKLALHCVDPSPAARPEVREVMQQLEEIKPELTEAGKEPSGVASATKEPKTDE